MISVKRFMSCFLIASISMVIVSQVRAQASGDDPCNQLPALGQLTGSYSVSSPKYGSCTIPYNPTVTYLDQQIHLVGMMDLPCSVNLSKDVQVPFFGTCKAGVAELHIVYTDIGDVQLNGSVDNNVLDVLGKDSQGDTFHLKLVIPPVR